MTGRQRIALLLAAAVVLAGAFVVFSGTSDDSGTTSTTTTAAEAGTAGTEAESPPAAKPKPRVERIRVPVTGEPRTLRWRRGDTIRLRISSPSDVTEVHVHGYDRELQIPAGKAKTLTFKANLEGIFEVEDHHSGQLLAKLEVRPS